MLSELDRDDWAAAFSYACGGSKASGTYGSGVPSAVGPGIPVNAEPFTRESVVEIIATSDGENDEADWIGVFRLADGRYACLEAGCDYSGWG